MRPPYWRGSCLRPSCSVPVLPSAYGKHTVGCQARCEPAQGWSSHDAGRRVFRSAWTGLRHVYGYVLFLVLARERLILTDRFASDIDVDTAIVQKQLWEAAKAGDIEGIELAIKGGADVNYKYPEEGNAAAMQSAALNGQAQAVVKLAEMGGDVSTQPISIRIQFVWPAACPKLNF